MLQPQTNCQFQNKWSCSILSMCDAWKFWLKFVPNVWGFSIRELLLVKIYYNLQQSSVSDGDEDQVWCETQIFVCLLVIMFRRRISKFCVKLKRATSRQGFSPSSAEVILLNRACHYTTKQKSHAFLLTLFWLQIEHMFYLLATGLLNSMIFLHEDSVYLSRIKDHPKYHRINHIGRQLRWIWQHSEC